MNTAMRYGLGVATGVFAVVVRIWLTPLLGDHTPYITVFVCLMAAARYFGLGPAILTALTSVFGVWFWFLAPGRTALDRSEIFGLVAFLFFPNAIIAFGEATRRSQAKQDETEQALRYSKARLKLAMRDVQNEIERRTAEIEQKTAQTMEQARLLDLANDAIFVRTANDRISFWNQGAERPENGIGLNAPGPKASFGNTGSSVLSRPFRSGTLTCCSVIVWRLERSVATQLLLLKLRLCISMDNLR